MFNLDDLNDLDDFKITPEAVKLPIQTIEDMKIRIVKRFLKTNDVNSLISNDNLPIAYPTLLHMAIWNADKKIVKFLISQGADLQKSFDTYNGSPLHLAIQKTKTDLSIVIELINNRAPINSYDFVKQWTPLHVAASKGNIEIALMLINHGANVNANGPCNGNSPLHVAIEFNQIAIVELLCKFSADVNLTSSQRGTPLLFAVACSNYNIANLLIRYGADVKAISSITSDVLIDPMSNPAKSCQLTPLHVAVILQKEKMVQLLLYYGANPRAVVEKFDSSFHCALQRQSSKIVRLLLDVGAGLYIGMRDRPYIDKWIKANHPTITSFAPSQK